MFANIDLKKGCNIICDENNHKDMLMDVYSYILDKEEIIEIYSDNKESAILLITGNVTLDYNGQTKNMSRKDVFTDNPYCLHVPKQTKVVISANSNAEILVQQKENEKIFDTKYYAPEDVEQIVAGVDEYDSTSKRIIRTIFDYNTAPYSNMVLGEVLSYTGRWNSYPPHHHPQPEVYYFKFDHPSGFGVSVIGDKAAVVKSNSVAYIPGGLVHPQATAPGYRMYYVWMIPHLENNPWTERIFAKEHEWLLEK